MGKLRERIPGRVARTSKHQEVMKCRDEARTVDTQCGCFDIGGLATCLIPDL